MPGLGDIFFPQDPGLQGLGVDPASIAQAQKQAVLQLGLGLLAAKDRGMGFGLGAYTALGNAKAGYQDAAEYAFRNTMTRRQLDQQNEDRAYELEHRKITEQQRQKAERAASATTAGRVAQGITAAPDPAAYLRLVGGMPEVKDTFSQFGVDPASDPGAIASQLGAAAQIDAPAAPASYTDDIKEYQLARQQGFKGNFFDYQRAIKQSAPAPKGQNWTKFERPRPDGKIDVGVIDMNAPTPEATFRPVGEPIDKNQNLRPVPGAIAQGIINNRQELAKIDRALAAVDKNPAAFGLKNYAPDAVTQRVPGDGYSGGVDARAKVADIGSLLIHDRSGAAVTVSEFPRLKPFIPQATDDPKVVKTKLQNLRANIAAIQEETEALFTPETGYKPISNAAPAGGGPVKVATDADYAALPSDTEFIAPDGSHRKKP